MSASRDRWGKDWSKRPSRNQYDIYFSHSRTIAETDVEKEMLSYLQSVCEPGTRVLNPLAEVPAGRDFDAAVEMCKRIVVATITTYGEYGHQKDYIGKGSASDIDSARKYNLPVFFLHDLGDGAYKLEQILGYTKVEGGDAKLRYARLNIQYERDWEQALNAIVHYKKLAAQMGKYQSQYPSSEEDIRGVFEIKENELFGGMTEEMFYGMWDLPDFEISLDLLAPYIAQLPQEEVDGILNLVQDIITPEEWYGFRIFLCERAAAVPFMGDKCPSCGTVTMHTPRQKVGKCPACGQPVAFAAIVAVTR